MRKFATVFLVSLAALAACAHAAATDTVLETLVLTNAVIIDGTGGPAQERMTVVINGDKIAMVGPTGAVQIPRGARVLNLNGQTLMPGLADMHVHLLGGWNGESVEMLGYRRYLNALLYAGVTTVLDTGNVQPYVVALRNEVAAGRLLGPRIYAVGALVDGPEPVWPPISYAANGVAGIPKIVASLKRDNVDFIKGYVGLSHDQIRALVTEGQKVGLKLIVDQWSFNGSPDIAAAGIYAFAHLPRFAFTEQGVGVMRGRGVHFITTLATMESFSRRRFTNLEFLKQPLIADTTPPLFIRQLTAHATKNLNEDQQRATQGSLARLKIAMQDAKLLQDGGVLIVAGTDAPYPGTFQGEGLHRELELLVEAGLTPLQAIAAATGNAAKFVGDESWGTIAPGKRADLIIVDGRPDRQIAATRKIRLVLQKGRSIDRARLKLGKDDPGFEPVSPVGAPTPPPAYISPSN